MSMNLTKVSFAAIVFCVATGCGKQDAPVADSGAVSSPINAPQVASPQAASSARGALNLVDYDMSTTPPTGGNCALDAINGGTVAGATVTVGSEVMFGGWIADAANQVPTEARLIFKGTKSAYSVPLMAGVERPDVATALGAEQLKSSGYNVLASLNAVPGTYEISIIHGPMNAAASCPLNASIMITE